MPLLALLACASLSSFACAAISSASAVFSSSVENFSSLNCIQRQLLIKISLKDQKLQSSFAGINSYNISVHMFVFEIFRDFAQLHVQVIHCSSAAAAFYFNKFFADSFFAAVKYDDVRPCNSMFLFCQRIFCFNSNNVFFVHSDEFWV